MAIIKCKMCGGDMELSADKTFGTCEYCGSVMTLPKVSDDQRAAAFNRGNHFRRAGEFDKALSVYERIVAEDDTDAEAHWCCALCRFGIEYVEDPATYEWLPTCHRASFDSFLEDVDYLAAVEHSEGVTRRQYQKDAAKIAEVQRGILATSQNEEPFDVFICYKESDENGQRTKDSTLAQDIYYQLTEQGRRVFFARITLEDKGGAEYEPYIFAALNSAKVMVAVGTRPEYFNAVWVKNEWSRFLSLMKKDHSKLLLPCYRDMAPYDLPEALSVLQSYDMGKIGFIQDLIRGINKVLDAAAPKAVVKETVVVSGGNANVAPLLKRVFMYLEDEDFDSADEYCERILDIDPENALGYLGKLMAELHVRKQEDLPDQWQPFDTNINYQKILRFGDEKLKATLTGYAEHIKSKENAHLNEIYTQAKDAMAKARTKKDYERAGQLFGSIREYLDSATLVDKCFEKAEIIRKDAVLAEAKSLMNGTLFNYENAVRQLETIRGWKDTDEQICICELWLKEAKQKQEDARKKSIARTALVKDMICARFDRFVCLKANGTVVSTGYIQHEIQSWTDIVAICCNNYHIAGLKRNGTVVAARHNNTYACNVNKWENIVEICAGVGHTVGLKRNGTVVATGQNDHGQCNVKNWSNIVAICAGVGHTVGLKKDGTVVATGWNSSNQCSVSNWSNIVAVYASGYNTVGLTRNGTVVVTGGLKSQCQRNMRYWTDIVAICISGGGFVGLKADGTAVATGLNNRNQCDVENWSNLVAICTGQGYTVGLKSDGTVVATGSNQHGQCNVQKWTDIVAIASGAEYTVGLKSDGTVVAVGKTNMGQCNVRGVKLFGSIDTIEGERQQAAQKYAQISQLQTQKNALGLFASSRKRELDAQIAALEEEIRKM